MSCSGNSRAVIHLRADSAAGAGQNRALYDGYYAHQPLQPRPVSNLYRNRDYRATFLATTLGVTGCVAIGPTNMTVQSEPALHYPTVVAIGKEACTADCSADPRGSRHVLAISRRTGRPGSPRAPRTIRAWPRYVALEVVIEGRTADSTCCCAESCAFGCHTAWCCSARC